MPSPPQSIVPKAVYHHGRGLAAILCLSVLSALVAERALAGSEAEVNKEIRKFTEMLLSGPIAERIGAAKRLAEIGAEAEPAIPALIKALDHPEDSVNRAAKGALERIGTPAVSPLLAVLQGEGPEQRRSWAALTLGTLRRDALARKDDATGQRVEAALHKALYDPGRKVANYSRMALTDRRFLPKGLVPEFLAVLKSDQSTVDRKCFAMLVLLAYEAEAAEAIPTLLDIWSDPKAGSQLRGSSAQALMFIGRHDRRVSAAFLAVLRTRHEDIGLRGTAASAAARLGEELRQAAVPDIVQALKEVERKKDNKESTFRGLLLIALDHVIPNDEGYELLFPIACDPLDVDRVRALSAIGNMGPRAEKAIPALVRILQNEQDGPVPSPVALDVVRTMGKIGRLTPIARNILAELGTLNESSPALKQEVAKTLANAKVIE